MKIALVSTYPPFPCGIARYTQSLITPLSSMKGIEPVVISEGGRSENIHNCPIHDSYSRHTQFTENILSKIEEEKPDLVHLQHAPDLFPDIEQFIQLIVEIERRGIGLVVTIHTADTGRSSRLDWKQLYTTILSHGHIIVHNSASKDALCNYPLRADKIHIIEHGTPCPDLPDQKSARNALGLKEDDFVFLILGFIHVLKNHHTTLLAFNLMQNNGKVKLLIAGKASGDKWYNKIYIRLLKLLAFINQNVIFHDRFIPDSSMSSYLAAANVLLLPYWQKYPSASGIFHLGIGSKINVLCSDSVKFSAVKEHLHDHGKQVFVPMLNIWKWRNAMTSFVKDRSSQREVRHLLQEYARKTSWENIAREHAILYKEVIRSIAGS